MELLFTREEPLMCVEAGLDHLDAINVLYVKTNMDLIDYDKIYTLTKTGVKKKHPEYDNKYVVMQSGRVKLLIQHKIFNVFDPKELYAALYIEDAHGLFPDWFRTSPVINCTKTSKGIRIETQNSYYLLTEDKKCKK